VTTPALTYKTVTLAAYETQRHAVSGTVFVCSSATAQFKLSFDGGEDVTMAQGWSVNWSAGFRFLVFGNPSASAVTLSYYAGNAAMAYASNQTVITIKDPATYFRAGALAISNGATLSLNGLDGVNVRKQIIITNLSANVDLDVLDPTGTKMATVIPRSVWTVETSGALKLQNNGGLQIDIRVAELFYSP